MFGALWFALPPSALHGSGTIAPGGGGRALDLLCPKQNDIKMAEEVNFLNVVSSLSPSCLSLYFCLLISDATGQAMSRPLEITRQPKM